VSLSSSVHNLYQPGKCLLHGQTWSFCSSPSPPGFRYQEYNSQGLKPASTPEVSRGPTLNSSSTEEMGRRAQTTTTCNLPNRWVPDLLLSALSRMTEAPVLQLHSMGQHAWPKPAAMCALPSTRSTHAVAHLDSTPPTCGGLTSQTPYPDPTSALYCRRTGLPGPATDVSHMPDTSYSGSSSGLWGGGGGGAVPPPTPVLPAQYQSGDHAK
jgi:hypothetical protein